jgi:uncharacterized SAM-binding protein YcdF (DUF218 family)
MSCAIVVLGSPNDNFGNLSTIAISRADKAYSEFCSTDDCKVLCTGGFGQHFNTTDVPHGKYVQNYLISKGVLKSSFIGIALSSFTIEDATLSKLILEKNSIMQVVLVTSDYHMNRARLVFSQIQPSIKFTYSEAKILMDSNSYKKLQQHEQKAIIRDLANI